MLLISERDGAVVQLKLLFHKCREFRSDFVFNKERFAMILVWKEILVVLGNFGSLFHISPDAPQPTIPILSRMQKPHGTP